jgi:hypothetical protein
MNLKDIVFTHAISFQEGIPTHTHTNTQTHGDVFWKGHGAMTPFNIKQFIKVIVGLNMIN